MEQSCPKDGIYSFLLSFFYQYMCESSIQNNYESFQKYHCRFMQQLYVYILTNLKNAQFFMFFVQQMVHQRIEEKITKTDKNNKLESIITSPKIIEMIKKDSSFEDDPVKNYNNSLRKL